MSSYEKPREIQTDLSELISFNIACEPSFKLQQCLLSAR